MKNLSIVPVLFFLLLPCQIPQKGGLKKTPLKTPQGFPGLKPRPAKRLPKPSDLIKGVWRISRTFFVGAPPGTQTRGYVVFTKKHASFHIVLKEARARRPVTQSGLWRYTMKGSKLTFLPLLNMGSDPQGKLRLQTSSTMQVRRFQFLGGILRLYRGMRGSYMDLIRIE